MRFIFLILLFSVTLQASVEYPVKVKKGGTGAITFAANGFLMGNGTSPLTVIPGITYVGTAGQMKFFGTNSTLGTIVGSQSPSNAFVIDNLDATPIIFYTNGTETGRWLSGGGLQIATQASLPGGGGTLTLAIPWY
jgi:hypothetical protein